MKLVNAAKKYIAENPQIVKVGAFALGAITAVIVTAVTVKKEMDKQLESTTWVEGEETIAEGEVIVS